MKTADELAREIEASVRAYFLGDESKVELWFNTPSPWLGGLPPRWFTREHELLKKLHKFVMDAQAAATGRFADVDQAARWLRDHEGVQEGLR